MIDKDVQSQQLQILERIFERGDVVQTPPLSGLLSEVQMYYPDVGAVALGNFYADLCLFTELIDLESPHPDLFHIYDGQLVGEQDGSFSRIACDVLDLVQIGTKEEHNTSTEILLQLQRCVVKHELYKLVSTQLGSPVTTLNFIRFVKDEGMRWSLRMRKMDQEVGMSVLMKKGESMWDSLPDNFDSFVRFNNRYDQDLKEARNKAEHLKKFGLSYLAADVEEYIKEVNHKNKTEQCCGFNRITLTTASVILGKQIGAKFGTKHLPYEYGSTTKIYIEESRDEDLFKQIEYTPKTYPYYMKRDNASENIRKVIKHLESFPDINNKPLFDHYRILLPEFADRRQRSHHGVLLGEKDGDHYFICYWEPRDESTN